MPNAGIWDYQRSITRLDGESLSAAFDELFAVNVKGYLLAVEASWRELVKTRGSVVMTLSNSAFYPNGGGPLYTASKHACRGLVLELAYELAPKVRVNGVAAGGMRTDLRGPESMGMAERSIEASFARSATTGDNPLLPLPRRERRSRRFHGALRAAGLVGQQLQHHGAIIPVDGGIAARGFRTAAGGDDL